MDAVAGPGYDAGERARLWLIAVRDALAHGMTDDEAHRLADRRCELLDIVDRALGPFDLPDELAGR